MTCRHKRDRFGDSIDPACSSYKPPEERAKRYEKHVTELRKEAGTVEPDHTVIDVEKAGDFLIMTVEYPSCPSCTYEGTKLMVFEATLEHAVRWKKIDPHFRGPEDDPTVAPSPVARFPATSEGVRMARALVHVL